MEKIYDILKEIKIKYSEYETFSILINCFLISKIRTNIYNGDDILKNIYPYIFENILFEYDSKEAVSIINFFNNTKIDDIVGYIYENSLSINNKKDSGKYYTRSNKVIEYMLESLTFDYRTQILEPSSGSGLFIIEMLKKLMKNIPENNIEQWLLSIFNNIETNDSDKMACKITEANILCTLIDFIKKAYIINPKLKLPKLKIYNYDFCKKNISQKYDLIIGNPPFVTLYGRRSRNMTEEKRKFYNQFKFVQNKKGNNKFNLSMFFIENSLDLLKVNGKLSFILDISFFEDAYIDIRKYLLKNYCIENLTINVDEFENVTSGQIILTVVNKKPTKNTLVHLVDYATKEEKVLKQSLWDNCDTKYKFFLPLDGISRNIINKMQKNQNLDFYFPNKSLRTCCALTGRTEDFVVDKNYKTNNTIFPYLEGSKGIAYKFAKPSSTCYIEYNYDLQIKISDEFKKELEALGVKNKKRVTLGDKECYMSPKLFIRQSANEIISSYTEDFYAANNSLYILTLKSNSEKDKKFLKYTNALLNSNLITYFANKTNIIRSGKGKTPQIKISDLKSIPIALSNEYYDEIIELSDSLQCNFENDKYDRLNNLVYSIYNISDKEQKYIEKAMS